MSEWAQISKREWPDVCGTHKHVFRDGQEPNHHAKLLGFAVVVDVVKVVHGAVIPVTYVGNCCAHQRLGGVYAGKGVR